MKKIIFTTIILICIVCTQISFAQQTDKVSEAFTEFKNFAKGIPIGSTYIQDIELTNGKDLKITYLRNSETIPLDRVHDGVITNYYGTQTDIESKRIEFYLSPFKQSSYFTTAYDRDYVSWTGLGSKTELFYVLLGNLIVAYKEANIKNFKQEISYAERLKIVTAKDFVDYIPKRTKIVLKTVGKNNEYFKQLKSYIGKDVEASPLYINGDLKTYGGRIYSAETQKDFKVSSIEIGTFENTNTILEKESEVAAMKTKKRQDDFNNMKTFSTEYLPPLMKLMKGKDYLGEKFFIMETPKTNNDAYPESFTITAAKMQVYYFVVVGTMDSVEFSYNGEMIKQFEETRDEKIIKFYLKKKQVKDLNAAGCKRWIFQFGALPAIYEKLSQVKINIKASSGSNVNQYAFVYCFKALDNDLEE